MFEKLKLKRNPHTITSLLATFVTTFECHRLKRILNETILTSVTFRPPFG